METQITLKRSEHALVYIMMMLGCLLFSFNSFGQMIGLPYGQNAGTILTESWVDINWQNSSKITNSFDVNNYLIHSLYQEWDVNNSVWVDKIQVDYTNNPNGTVNQAVYQAMSTSNTWENAQRMTYTYNGLNQVLTVITDIFYIGDWRPYMKLTNSYDSSGYLTNGLTQSIDLQSGALTNSSQTNFTNLANGKVDFSITQTWTNGAPGLWINSEQTIYSYDANYYIVSILTQKWVASLNNWKNDSLSDFTNDSQGRPTQIIVQNSDASSPGGWVNATRITFDYSLLGVKDFSDVKNFTIYPVPAHDRIMIKTNDNVQGLNYFISDETGRVFQRGKFDTEETTIDISQLSTGVYFCQVGGGKGQAVKIIKE